MKLCSHCNIIKSDDDFRKNKRYKYKIHCICKSCLTAYNQKYYDENKISIKLKKCLEN